MFSDASSELNLNEFCQFYSTYMLQVHDSETCEFCFAGYGILTSKVKNLKKKKTQHNRVGSSSQLSCVAMTWIRFSGFPIVGNL